MRKHWFFDFDGTLCDTAADIMDAWRATFAAMGREAPDFDRVFRIGPSIDQIARELFGEEAPALVETIRGHFTAKYDGSGFPKTAPYPWIPALLEELRAQGCKLYVATNKRYSAMGPLMRKLGWEGLFEGYYSFDMYPGERLRKGDLLKRVLAERGIDAADAVMFGDTAGDVEAGKEAGMRTIGCTWGYGAAEELEGADEIRHAP